MRIEVGTMFTGQEVRYIITDDGDIYPQKAVVDCARCHTDAYVPHFNCMYAGKAIGHSEGHCTANACY